MTKFRLSFAIYLSVLFILSAFFLITVYQSETNNSMAEWLINYQGGFTRRGFLGEIIFQMSILFDFELRKGFLLLQIFIYFIYFLSIYYFFKDTTTNYLFCLAIFSPVFFLFSLAELEALGRKELLMFSAFLINFLLYKRFNNLNYNYLYFLITLPIIMLTHEIYIIYISYFILFFLLFEKNYNSLTLLKFFTVILSVLIILFLILTNDYDSTNLKQMCDSLLLNKNEKCGLAPYSMISNIGGYRAEVDWKFTHIVRYVMIFIVGFGVLTTLIAHSNFNEKEVNKYLCKIKFPLLFLILFLPSILPFFTAVDSGRYTSMAYNMAVIFFFGCYNFNKINIDFELIKKRFRFLIIESKYILFLIFLTMCFTWNPKAVYHEDIGSIPIYRLLAKFINYLWNF